MSDTIPARKPRLDTIGFALLLVTTLLFAGNQLIVKVTNHGLQPAFQAGLRSVLALLCLLGWMRLRGIPLGLQRQHVWLGVFAGVLFSFEFLLLFVALDLTTIPRSAVMFYSMPVWMALAAHFLLPGERIGAAKALGLALAMGGVIWAMASRGQGGHGSLIGDLCALAATFGWMGIALMLRISRLKDLQPEQQLVWQLLVSAPILLAAAPFFGPLLRGPTALHWSLLVFQAAIVVTFAFVLWFWLLKRYPTSHVASFSFLTPVLAGAMGWAILGEPMGLATFGALALVAVGLALISRAN